MRRITIAEINAAATTAISVRHAGSG